MGKKEIKKYLWAWEASRLGPSVIGLCSRRVLAAALCRNSQSCLAGPSKPPENKIAAFGSTKQAPLEPQRYPSPGERLRPPPSSGVLPSRQQYRVCLYPGTPPPSVYQVTHGTALQAAECYVMHLSCGDGNHIISMPQALQVAECYVMHHVL